MAGWFSKKKSETPASIEVSEAWNWNASEGFVVLDVETTGLSPKSNRLLEVALIQTSVEGLPLAYWSTLINPSGPVGATDIHGITDSDVKDSPAFADIADELMSRLKGQAVAAHNASFDLGFLRYEFARVGWELPEVPTVCTLAAGRHFLPQLQNHRLSDCATALGIPSSQQHRALDDAAVTASILNYFIRREAAEGSPLSIRTIPGKARLLKWPTEKGEPAVLGPSSKASPRRNMSPLDEELLKVLVGVSAADLVGDDSSNAVYEYAELLLEVLEDGVVADDEAESLRDLAEVLQVPADQVESIHMRLLEILAAEAWRDGVVSQAEKRHLSTFAQLLGFSSGVGKQVLDACEEARNEKLAHRTKDLPSDWVLGEPVCVGDRVVFTGCDEFDRFGMERKATKKGLRVTGSVSGKTNLVVSDGSVQGNKLKAATDLNIRVVHPTEFLELLTYIQPASPAAAASDKAAMMETLTCRTCGKDFERVSVKGRKPVQCPECR